MSSRNICWMPVLKRQVSKPISRLMKEGQMQAATAAAAAATAASAATAARNVAPAAPVSAAIPATGAASAEDVSHYMIVV
jgi:hypothetical protein